MKTVIIGVGNPILTDDGVGIYVARSLKALLGSGHLPGDEGNVQEGKAFSFQNVDVLELSAGGIRLMEAMAGYDRALIIDAIVTGAASPGTVHRLQGNDLVSTKNTMSVHDMNLPIALEMGKLLGVHLPSRIRIWGIEALDVETFSEDLTEDVAKATPEVISEIIAELLNDQKECLCAGIVHATFQDELTGTESL
jgi:hydrogenase maturation protease